jgi:hypothetical protein
MQRLSRRRLVLAWLGLGALTALFGWFLHVPSRPASLPPQSRARAAGQQTDATGSGAPASVASAELETEPGAARPAPVSSGLDMAPTADQSAVDAPAAGEPRLQGRWMPNYAGTQQALDKLKALEGRVDLGGSDAAQTLLRLQAELRRMEIRFTRGEMLTLQDGKVVQSVPYQVRERHVDRLVLQLGSSGELVVDIDGTDRLRLRSGDERPLPLVRLPG